MYTHTHTSLKWLYPTPSSQDAGYLTEVHHINGEGDDAGVVYCEMQAWENMAENITDFHLAQHMYPGGCGYKVGVVLLTVP